jgi:hypothetical protein
MGYYVGVNLSFSTNSLRRLQEVASKTLADDVFRKEEVEENFENSYTEMMLKQIADNTDKYIHQGNKGSMFIWGGVWNYYTAKSEIPHLKRFFKNIWEYEDNEVNIMFDFDKALLIVNPEQSETSYFYEFSWNKDKKEVIVKNSESELNWNQY